MNAFPWLDLAGFTLGDFALRLTVTLLHFLWQGLVIALVVFIATQTMSQASARARYAVSFAGLLLMAACVPVTFALLTRPQVEAADARTTAASTLLADEKLEATIVAPLTPSLVAEADTSNTSSIESTVGSLPQPSSREPVPSTSLEDASHATRARLLTRLAPMAAMAYLLGVAFMLTRLACALCGGQRLRKSAIPVSDPGILLIVRPAR
jgi:hypothetical protein